MKIRTATSIKLSAQTKERIDKLSQLIMKIRINGKKYYLTFEECLQFLFYFVLNLQNKDIIHDNFQQNFFSKTKLLPVVIQNSTYQILNELQFQFNLREIIIDSIINSIIDSFQLASNMLEEREFEKMIQEIIFTYFQQCAIKFGE